jgi:FlgD Ig-like domain
MRPAALLSLLALLLAAAPAASQINPADMRSGCAAYSSITGLVSSSLFVVPSGSRFVLTDVTLARASATAPAPPGGGFPIRLSINLGGTTPVSRWLVTDHWVGSDLPIQLHMSTGIVFDPNQSVEAAISVYGGTEPYVTVCWSGYLAPATTTSVVPGPSSGDDLALEAWPNPSRESTELSFRLDRSQKVVVGVFAVDGRRVRVLRRGMLDAGEHRVAWDGRDDAGRLVGNGVYFAQLETANGKAARRIARVR